MQDRRIINLLEVILKALHSNLDKVKKTKLHPAYPISHTVYVWGCLTAGIAGSNSAACTEVALFCLLCVV